MALYANGKRICKTNIVKIPPIEIPRATDKDGLYGADGAVNFTLDDKVIDIGDYALSRSFMHCNTLTSMNLRSLREVSGREAFYYTFNNCTNLTSIDLSNLTTISGYEALGSTFSNCSSLTAVSFPSLTTISSSIAMLSTFSNCSSLISASFPNLSSVSGEITMGSTFSYCRNLSSVDFSSLKTLDSYRGLSNIFNECISLKSLSFPSLHSNSFSSYTNQFNSMLQGVTGCTVHFPSNLQSVIGSWSDVTNGFQGIDTTVLFDLPDTGDGGLRLWTRLHPNSKRLPNTAVLKINDVITPIPTDMDIEEGKTYTIKFAPTFYDHLNILYVNNEQVTDTILEEDRKWFIKKFVATRSVMIQIYIT